MELNRDVIYEILSWLPWKSLAGFSCVCKDWQGTISSTFFLKAHLQKRGLIFTDFNLQDEQLPTGLLPEDVTTLASCNGLICCRSRSKLHSTTYVCDPVSKQYIEVPFPRTCIFEIGIAIASDLGGKCITTLPNFKLVQVELKGAPYRIQFELYSSKTKAWTTSTATWTGEPVRLKRRAICIGRVLYWLTYDQTILVFDVETGMARLISCPHVCASDIPYHVLGESEGSLHYVLITADLGLCVWRLDSYSDERWTRKYSELPGS